MLGVIGGSGLYQMPGLTAMEPLTASTPFGEASDGIVRGRLGETTVVFLPRHGRAHSRSPSALNYRANIYALKSFGVTHVLSVSAVGSLREDDPGHDPVLAFMVADGSDDPRELPRLTTPLLEGRADLVIGSRTRGYIEPGAMPPWQRGGSLFAAAVLTARFGATVTDLGPFRAIRRSTLDALGMRDRTYGWTLEMQIKAAREGLRVLEAPVAWRHRRGGSPKVAGTLRGTLGASRAILAWLDGAVRGPDHDPVR